MAEKSCQWRRRMRPERRRGKQKTDLRPALPHARHAVSRSARLRAVIAPPLRPRCRETKARTVFQAVPERPVDAVCGAQISATEIRSERGEQESQRPADQRCQGHMEGVVGDRAEARTAEIGRSCSRPAPGSGRRIATSSRRRGSRCRRPRARGAAPPAATAIAACLDGASETETAMVSSLSSSLRSEAVGRASRRMRMRPSLRYGCNAASSG